MMVPSVVYFPSGVLVYFPSGVPSWWAMRYLWQGAVCLAPHQAWHSVTGLR